MLLVQKLLNHPVFTLPAWQLEGCQTLLQFFICTQFRWFGAQAVVCVWMCVCLVSSVSLIALLFTPFLSNSPYFLYFSSAICLSSAVFFSCFSSICGFTPDFSLSLFLLSSKTLHLLLPLHHSPSLSLSFMSSLSAVS